jgi:signal transduction histidine kinase
MAEAAAPPPQSILVLNESAMVGPFYSGAYAALRSTVGANSSHPVAIFVEQLELERFGGDRYERTLRTYLKSKYGEQPIGVIVALGFAALDFVLRVGQEIWPEVPVVFVMVDDEALKKLPLSPNVTGRTARVKFRDALSAARAVVPNLHRIAIVGDNWEVQTAYRHFKDEIPIDTAGLQIIDLVGLPMRELRKRVAVLPKDTAIIYTSIFSDGEGTSYPPVDALGLVAEVANRPIVHAAETFLGHGGVGGYVLTPAAVGKEGAALALRILNGESTSSIPIVEGDVVRPIFDWRELERWGVDESRLPEGSEIRFRTPTLWQQYRVQLFAVLAVLLLQSALITWLVYEHHRRRVAERIARSTMSELTHLNRMATAGELSASIAHEVSQPITGMMAGAGLALRSLAGRTPDLEKVRTLLEQIVNAGRHASEILDSIRASFKKSTQMKDQIDINKLILMVLNLTQFELQGHGIEVRTQLSSSLPSVVGNAVQLQQVILNLVMNALEAMHRSTSRVLTVKTEFLETDVVHVSIEDTGMGIDPHDLKRVFEPLFTTKAGGMGMGLAICHSIIQGHHGRIWVSAGAEIGSIFEFAIPSINYREEIRSAS